MYVFGPRSNSWDGGLYPYRRIAYTCWLGFPVIAASLVFINHGGYTTQGNSCYLPIRPFWYRLALSWVPRYTIFIVILGLYTTMYFYVNRKLHGFRREGAKDLDSRMSVVRQLDEGSYIPRHHESVPPVPPLNLNGLLPESRPASIVESKEPSPLVSLKTLVRSPMSPTQWALPKWTKPGPATSQSEVVEISEQGSSETDSFIGPSTPKPKPSYVASDQVSLPNESPQSVVPSLSRKSSWRDNFVRRFSPSQSSKSRPSNVNINSILQERSEGHESSTQIPCLRLTNTRGEDLQELDLIQTRNKFRRQLWFIFLYPLIYMLMWTIPFIYHILQYNDNLAMDPPFALRVLVTLIICLQAAVDCWLFSSREKPWKHMPDHDGTFLGSLKFWQGWSELRKRSAMLRHGPGKTREEMHREASLAYRRRNEEIAERRNSIIPRVHGMEHQEQHAYWWSTERLMKTAPSSLTFQGELEELHSLKSRLREEHILSLSSMAAMSTAGHGREHNIGDNGAQV